MEILPTRDRETGYGLETTKQSIGQSKHRLKRFKSVKVFNQEHDKQYKNAQSDSAKGKVRQITVTAILLEIDRLVLTANLVLNIYNIILYVNARSTISNICDQ